VLVRFAFEGVVPTWREVRERLSEHTKRRVEVKTVGAAADAMWSFKIDSTKGSVVGSRREHAWELELEPPGSAAIVEVFAALGGRRCGARELGRENDLDYSAVMRSEYRYRYASPTIEATDRITVWVQPVLADPRFDELERAAIVLTTGEIDATAASLTLDHADTAEPWRDDLVRCALADLRSALSRWQARSAQVWVREE
jgi:hypothetical protein